MKALKHLGYLLVALAKTSTREAGQTLSVVSLVPINNRIVRMAPDGT